MKVPVSYRLLTGYKTDRGTSVSIYMRGKLSRVEMSCVFLKVAAACTYVAVEIKQGKLRVAFSA